MSKKVKYLDKMQRDLVQSKFTIDHRYTQSLKPQISDWFKKMKPLPEFSRIFQDYNKRYFTLNLTEITLYYSNKETYSLKDITYIPFEDVTQIIDKPHYALSNQGIEWKEAFGFTLYLMDKYIVLVAQSNEIYMLWLNFFEAIRFKEDGRSVLNRTRTPYYSNLFVIKLPDFQMKQQSSSGKKSISNKDLDSETPIFTQKEQKSSQSVRNLSPRSDVSLPYTSAKMIPDQFDQYSDQKNINEDIKQDQFINRQTDQEIVNVEVVQKIVNLDFQQQIELNPKQEQEEEVEDLIINLHQNNTQKNENPTSYLPLPKRLDKPKKVVQSNNQIKSTLTKTITNVWGTYDKEGNEIIKPKVVESNFLKESNQGLFINVQDMNMQNDNQIDQPEFLVRFDELDSSRFMEHN